MTGKLPIIALVIIIIIIIIYFRFKKSHTAPSNRILTATTSGNIYGYELTDPVNNLAAISMLNTINQAIAGTWNFDNVDTTLEIVIQDNIVKLHSIYKPRPEAPVQHNVDKYEPITYIQVLPTISFATGLYNYTATGNSITFSSPVNTPSLTAFSATYTR